MFLSLLREGLVRCLLSEQYLWPGCHSAPPSVWHWFPCCGQIRHFSIKCMFKYKCTFTQMGMSELWMQKHLSMLTNRARPGFTASSIGLTARHSEAKLVNTRQSCGSLLVHQGQHRHTEALSWRHVCFISSNASVNRKSNPEPPNWKTNGHSFSKHPHPPSLQQVIKN